MPNSSQALADSISPAHKPPAHMPALDGLRGLAILLVILDHCMGIFGRGSHGAAQLRSVILGAGWIGVDLFFVLSGFLITGILLATKTSPDYFKSFFARRALRIFPLYYLTLLVVLCAYRTHFDRQDVSSLAFYYYNFRAAYLGHHLFMVTPMWSLAVEEQFYLLWPLFVYRFDIRRLRSICFLGVVFSLALRLLIIPKSLMSQPAYLLTPCRTDALLAGALLAIWRTNASDWKRVQKYASSFALISLAALAAIAIYTGHFYDYIVPSNQAELHHTSSLVVGPGLTLLAVLFATLVAKAVHHGTIYRIFLNRPLRRLGKYSYGMYLFHNVVIAWYAFHVAGRPARTHIAHDVQSLLCIPLVILTTFAGAYFSFHLFEQHFLRLKRRFPAL